MKIYTGDGDELTTTLVDEIKVKKNDCRIELLGNIDELNCHLGLIKASNCHSYIKSYLETVQETLLVIMYSVTGAKCTIQHAALTDLEEQIDFLESQFKRSARITLPGKCIISARLDIARAVTRRCERSLATVCDNHDIINTVVKKYLNRLSDYLFVAARYTDSTRRM